MNYSWYNINASRPTQFHLPLFSAMIGFYWSERDVNCSILGTWAKDALKRHGFRFVKKVSEFFVSNNVPRELYVIRLLLTSIKTKKIPIAWSFFFIYLDSAYDFVFIWLFSSLDWWGEFCDEYLACNFSASSILLFCLFTNYHKFLLEYYKFLL